MTKLGVEMKPTLRKATSLSILPPGQRAETKARGTPKTVAQTIAAIASAADRLEAFRLIMRKRSILRN